MKVVLKEDIVGLGDIGETVIVKGGYARNFLIPRGKALETASRSVKQIAHNMKQIEAKKRQTKLVAEEVAQKVRDLSIEFSLRVTSTGKVFGSIGQRDISAELAKNGIEVERRRVELPEPIKKLGTHFVFVKLHPEVKAQLKIAVNKTAATKEEEKLAVRSAQTEIETASAIDVDAEAESEALLDS